MEAAGIEPGAVENHTLDSTGQKESEPGQNVSQVVHTQDVKLEQSVEQGTGQGTSEPLGGQTKNTISAQQEHNMSISDSELVEVVELWDRLPEHIRKTILDLVNMGLAQS